MLGWAVFMAASIPANAADAKITITGSSTIAPLAAELAKRFEEKHPRARIDVQSGGSSRGVADARSGVADIGLVSRALHEQENDLKGFVVARDGVCIILHRDNPVSTLSNQQVIDIYTGKITDWGAVGGKPGRITVVNKAEGRSTLELFLHYFNLKASNLKPQVVIGDNQQGIKTVSGNPMAIGYVSIGTAEYEAGAGTPIKLLAMNGVAATVENVKNSTFPLARPLNLVTKTAPTGQVKAFIDFALSPQVHDIVREQYFVPVGP
jgi:phosphate transport system substrate-binding protein